MPQTPGKMWEALTHIFRRIGVPHTVEFAQHDHTLYTADFAHIMPLSLTDWGRLPPTLVFTSARLPAGHRAILDAVRHIPARDVPAALPQGYLNALDDLPGPPTPPPYSDEGVCLFADDVECEEAEGADDAATRSTAATAAESTLAT
jgi:hypothetical protein